MTGDGYLLALAETDGARESAENQMAGTLVTLVVMNEVLGGGESSLFCLSDERASVLDIPLLRQEFTDWLRETPPSLGPDEAAGGLPVSMLALAFMSAKFPCDTKPVTGTGDSDAEIRSRLLRSAPK